MESKTTTPKKIAELKLAPVGSYLAPSKQEAYDGGFHISATGDKRKKGKRVVSKRSALQNFSC
jgi:hypothetical protein